MVQSAQEIIEESFGNYAGAVAQSRAFVDVRDCLKPSARQINWSLYDDGYTANKAFNTTQRVYGSVAKYYIHGDSSAIGVMMRESQDFAMRYPLMEVNGNAGNLKMSGNWAAERYTKTRLSEFSSLLFEDIKKDTITEWLDNYDDTEKYPRVLPTKGYYNICNGTSGIGVGVASSIPQFNLREVNKALTTLLLNPNATFEELYCAPDFATGGFLINESEVREALRYGSKQNAKDNNAEGASCKLRAKIDYDDKDKCLVVTEMPYSVYTNTICEQLEAIVNDEELNPGIDRFNDLTGKTPLIKIYLVKGADPNRIIKFLYKNTSLQYHFAINMTMLDMGKYPKVFSWKEALQAHIDHEKDVYIRGFNFDLKKIEYRIHIIDGLLICLASIDDVVKTIKSSNSTDEAKANLMKKFLLDEEQAKAVLDMKLAKLAHLEVAKLEDEKTSLSAEADRIKAILNNEELLNNELIKTWNDVAAKYGDDRRTKIITVAETKEEKEIEMIKAEDVVVVTTQSGYIKRIPTASFKVQKKGGKGVKSGDDILLDVVKTNTIDTMMFFTSAGKMYRTVVDNIPEGTNATKGVMIGDLVKLEANEKVIAVTSLHRKTTPKFVIFVTKQGMFKKSNLEEYMKSGRNTGIAAMTVKEGDEVVNIIFQDDEDMIIITKGGMSIRFATDSVLPVGRVAQGVIGIKLDKNDSVVSALPVHKSSDHVAILTENGMGKKVAISEFPMQSRAGKGTQCSTTSVAGALMVDDSDNILLSGKPNSICISAKDIPLLSKKALGNKMINSGSIVKVVKL